MGIASDIVIIVLAGLIGAIIAHKFLSHRLLAKSAKQRLVLATAIYTRYLIVQSPVIINISYEEHSTGQEIQYAAEPLAHVHSVNAENAQESEQYPGKIVVDTSLYEP